MAAINMGIVGTGGMANTHARRYRELRGVRLRACFDVERSRAQQFAQQHQVQTVTESLNDLLSLCDAVSVVTPDQHHTSVCLPAFKAGKHVLCEKPLATNLSDARRVARSAIKATERHDVRHLVNFSYRNSPAVQEAIRIVQRGDLGEPRHVHGHYLQSWLVGETTWGHWQDSQFVWRLQTSQGSLGVLGDVGSHLLDLVSAITGDVRSLDCSLATFPKTDRAGQSHTQWDGQALDANDTAVIRLTFQNGAVGVCHTTRWATGYMNNIALTVHGTDGSLKFDLDQGDNILWICRGKDQSAARWKQRTLRPTPTIYQRFVRAIRTGNPDQPDMVRGAQVQSYLDACQRSAEQNGPSVRIHKWT